MKIKIWLISIIMIAALLLVFSGQSVSAYFSDGESSSDNVLRVGIIEIPSLLGSADNFAVLAGSGITNTGTSTITGDIGSFPTDPVHGGTITFLSYGTDHGSDNVTEQAQTDLTIAYNYLAAQSPISDLTGQDLGGLVLLPGVYKFDTAAQLTGTLTLDASGNSSAVFIFQIGSTLTTASSSNVSLINSARAANVYWQVGSSATIGTNTAFAGNIVTLTSITLNTGVTLDGRALASNGAVTLDTDNITKPAP
jgi:type VI secretion system secreted protein VgrG